jgi:hypothetical protein
MSHLKAIAISFVVTSAVIAVVFRVPAVRKIVIGSN